MSIATARAGLVEHLKGVFAGVLVAGAAGWTVRPYLRPNPSPPELGFGRPTVDARTLSGLALTTLPAVAVLGLLDDERSQQRLDDLEELLAGVSGTAGIDGVRGEVKVGRVGDSRINAVQGLGDVLVAEVPFQFLC